LLYTRKTVRKLIQNIRLQRGWPIESDTVGASERAGVCVCMLDEIKFASIVCLRAVAVVVAPVESR